MTDTVLSPVAAAVLASRFGVPDAPIRLPEATRQLAARYLSGEIGQTMECATFMLRPEAADLPLPLRYAASIALIAAAAPLRLDASERLAGAATLLEACRHQTPASAITTPPIIPPHQGSHVDLPPIASTSHTTIDFEKVLRIGYQGIRTEIEDRRQAGGLDDAQATFLQAMTACLDAAQVWHARHVAALEALRDATGNERIDDVLAALRRVPEAPPETFHEALQSLWFAWTFQRLCGNWSGLGRVDKMLGPYLQRDLEADRLTLDDARDLLAHFWIKGCEWIGTPTGFGQGSSGDAQFYQNVVLGGIDEEGREGASAVTFLILDIVEELHISDFPIAVRVSERTPIALWEKIAAVQRQGGGIVSIYHEDLVIRALTRFGFPLEDARDFANDGCWEAIIPGRTAFGYIPFDALQLLQQTLELDRPGTSPAFPTFEDLYRDFLERLRGTLDRLADETARAFPRLGMTAPLLSLLVDGCIAQARDYHHGGAQYTMLAPHAGGLPDVANSLHVIRKAVYEERKVALETLTTALTADWAGYTELQRRLSHDYLLYGNGDPEADAMMQRVFDDYTALAGRTRDVGGVLCPPGISTFGREIGWRSERLASAQGRPAHAILAGNLAPTPGSDRNGPTAVITSFCRMNFEKLPNGVPLDLTLSPTLLKGEDGLQALVALLRTFVRLGGWYLQINVLDAAMLREAQLHPECHPNLVVRISGWSARFATLDADWQEMVIQRIAQADGRLL